jgi:tryptophan synthase alpha chain
VSVLEKHLRGCRDRGRKALAVYLTGCLPDRARFVELVRAVTEAGADVIEAGIPWSDPVIDGPVIQRASQQALEQGVTPLAVLDAVAEAEVPVPVVAMTYVNPVMRLGVERFADELAGRGLDGAIVPDLPLEESASWEAAAAARGLAAVLLAPPNASDLRLRAICERSSGFVYGVSLLGVTGQRSGLPATAARIGKRLRATTEKPILIGLGIGTGAQAAEASAYADGVAVGSAVVARVLEGVGVERVARFVGELREGLDS